MTATHAYVCRARCGHVVAIHVEDPATARDTARECDAIARKGGTVERMRLPSESDLSWCHCSKAARWSVRP